MLVTNFSLDNKVAIITGASRGIGKAIALGFAGAGANIVLVSRNLAALEDVGENIKGMGREALVIQASIDNEEDITKVVEATTKTFGKIDILVNNAAISPILKNAEKVSLNEWNDIIGVNLTGTFLFSREVGKIMIDQNYGKIVNMTSVGGVVCLQKQIAYCVSKAGIMQLTKVLAVEWVKYNINVNAIAPAYIETELTQGMRKSEVISMNLLARTPMKRFGKPEEIVGLAIYLASDASSYVTGQTFFIDGGWLSI